MALTAGEFSGIEPADLYGTFAVFHTLDIGKDCGIISSVSTATG